MMTWAAPPPGTVPRQSLDSQRAADPQDVEALLALAQACLSAGRYSEAERLLKPGVSRFPEHPGILLTWIDLALAQGQPATALERVQKAVGALGEKPELQFRAALAHFRSGTVLGQAEVRTVPGGRSGQFAGRYLLVEPRDAPDRFLCCPKESALYQLRLALDAGLDQPAAHLLHARIWEALGRPRIGLDVLKARAAVLLSDPEPGVLEAFSELALRAGALPEYLRFQRLLAQRQPALRNDILFRACLTVAENYSQRGEDRLYREWLYRAARISPNDTGVLLRLADAEWTAGQQPRAAELYRRVLECEPGHRERARILARLAEREAGEAGP